MLVQVDNIEKSFHDSKVLDQISFSVDEGDLVALIGPSGCGKSTLLRCMNGLETIDEGLIQINGIELKSKKNLGDREYFKRTQNIRARVGMVFQSFNLFPHLTLMENIVKAPQIVQSKPLIECQRCGEVLLKKVGLWNHRNHFPEELSGGQQQRAAIARALAMKPNILLYDEPTSSLDPTLVEEVLQVMKQLDQEGMTQIIVTHELKFAKSVADKIIFMEAGKIVEMGSSKDVFEAPTRIETRRFLRHFL